MVHIIIENEKNLLRILFCFKMASNILVKKSNEFYKNRHIINNYIKILYIYSFNLVMNHYFRSESSLGLGNDE